MIAISENTWSFDYFWFRLLLACRSFEAKDYWTFSHCFHRISFCSRVYMYVHGMRYLHHEVHELDGYNHEFWKTSGYSLKCVLELVASTSHAKVSHSTGLSWTSSNTYFLSHNYCKQNKAARSEIYQRHLKLWIQSYQAHHNFEINLMSFVLQSLWYSWHPDNRWWRQKHSTEWDFLSKHI